MIQLSLYTTLGCHLCTQLEGLVATLANQKVWLHHIEISDDDALVERYGVIALAATALTPLPFSLGCWAAGALKMPFSTFFAVALLRIPRVAGYLALIYFGLISVTP